MPRVSTRAPILLGLMLAVPVLGAESVSPQVSRGFERDVLPILQMRCTHCHDAKNETGLNLGSLDGLLKGGKTGPAVRLGSLRESLLWNFIATDKMPDDKTKLTNDQKDTIRRWLLSSIPKAGLYTSLADAKKQGVQATARTIDTLVLDKLNRESISPAQLSDDATFSRRVHLDLTGKIPTTKQTLAFLNDADPNKRAKLVDALLDSPDFGRHRAFYWHKQLIPKAAAAYRRIPHDKFRAWLADSFAANRPWDAIVTDLVTAVGHLPSNKNNANARKKDAKLKPLNVATAFVSVHSMEGRPQPKAVVTSVSRLFLGQSIECAQCHNHPLAKWKKADFWAAVAFFERVRFTKAMASDEQVGQLIEPNKGKPLVYEDKKKGRYSFVPGVYSEPVTDMEDAGGKRTGKMIRVRHLDGDTPTLGIDESPRAEFAEWMTARDNPFFARAYANRVWANLVGRGFVDPIDDLAEDNPPSHPELLDALASEFLATGYDIKHLYRCICTSKTYQRSSIPADGEPADPSLFAHQALRQLTEEQLLDSLRIAVPTFDARLEKDAVDKNPGLFRRGFLEEFEAGDGSPTEYSRGIQQALRLMNGDGKLFTRDALKGSVRDSASPSDNIERIYLQVLGRKPTPDESRRMTEFVEAANKPKAEPKKKRRNKNEAPPDPYSDILWVLLNSGEFAFVH